jgi:hypothetical protein
MKTLRDRRPHRIKRATGLLVRTVIFAVCGALSAFLLMSGYESVYNRSLPLVHTIDPVNLTALTESYKLDAKSYDNKALYGDFGRPQTVKLPDRSFRFNVAAPIYYKGQWLSRATALHLLLPDNARSGNIGVALLYCRSGFRTINTQNLPAVGSNIFMDTDKDWRYVYKVTSAKVFSDQIPYVVSDTGASGKLVIACDDSAAHTDIVVEATLLSVQGVDQ